MSTSVLPWLPAIFLTMIGQTIKQKIGPSSMRVCLSSSAPVSAAVEKLCSKKTHVSWPTDHVAVQTLYKHPLTKKDSAVLAKLPMNKNPLTGDAPKRVAGIAQGIGRQLDKHDIGGQVQITNNEEHFQTDETQWSEMKREIAYLKKSHDTMEKDIQDLKNFREERLRSSARSSERELDRAKSRIQHQLGLRHRRKENRTTESFEMQREVRAARNTYSDSLDLMSCLYVVEEDPTQELTFDALFGLSSSEARALYEFDRFQKFRVETILSKHANLWKSASAKAFFDPFKRWLDNLRDLRSKQDLDDADPALITSVERLAIETLEAAKADLII